MFRYFFALAFIFSASASLADNEGNTFTGADAVETITHSLVEAGAGADIKVQINEVRDEETIINSNDAISAKVDDLNLDKDHARWKAVLLFTSAGKNLPPTTVSGTYDQLVSIPVLKHQIRSGEVIGQEDVEFIKQPTRFIHKNTITDAKEIIGKSPRHTISQNRPVRQEEIANPAIMMKGAHVTLLFKSHNLEIKTLGEALDSGAKGDMVRVRNIASKAIVSGMVQSAGIVLIISPDSSTGAM